MCGGRKNDLEINFLPKGSLRSPMEGDFMIIKGLEANLKWSIIASTVLAVPMILSWVKNLTLKSLLMPW